MNETSDSTAQRKYHVKVGLAECTVSSRSKEGAVRLARKEFNQQMPNMSRVISGILDKEFRVDQVG